jgi:hypothetical protein
MTGVRTRLSTVMRQAEAGGWSTLRRPEPSLTVMSAADLLARTAGLPGNLRYITGKDGGIELLGEVPGEAGETPGDPAHETLGRLLAGPDDREALPEEEPLEAALEAAGLAWCRRETAWAVPASAGLPRELQITPEPGAVRVAAALVEWDEIGEGEAAALARFLVAAQAWLRFARCELEGGAARVVSRAAAARLETDLAHSVLGVAAGCRLLAREASALLVPEVARHYLEFHGPAVGR